MAESAPARADDFLDIYASPTAVFERRSDARFGLAYLVLSIAMIVLFFATKGAMQPIMDAEFNRAMAANQNLTPEQVETARRFAGTAGSIFAVVVLLLMPFVLGLGVWIGGRPVGARLSYAQSATIATFALFPRLIESVVNAAQALLLDESKLTSRFSVSLGLGRLLDADATSPVLLALVGRIDLFTLWITVLIALGLRTMGRISTGAAAAGAAFIWLLGAIPLLLQALRAG